ncbi:MAG: glycosyltransferase family 4 protein [Synergistaceae bacterium]|jgi:glycosyltransferase involved in cell wall biosynthesis|nr:glycosyltransferase family 4 protein [Synergistaceae bacterium]
MSRVMLVVPEFSEGGVERHVLNLANGLCGLGCWVTVVSAGGALASGLSGAVRRIELPVHKKNLLSIVSCARRLSEEAVGGGIQIVHAHSRVPAWIGWLVRRFTGIKLVCTAHSRYSLNWGLWPLRRADGVICVSRAVRDHLYDWLPGRNAVDVIHNPAPDRVIPWVGSGGRVKRLLYLGRLTPKKGPMVLIEALGSVGGDGWILDVVGDGPYSPELQGRSRALGIGDRVIFHGHRDDAAEWISRCDLFLFPSLDEGMGLSLSEALLAGAPVLASNLAAVREITNCRGLIAPGEKSAWASRIEDFLWQPPEDGGLEITVKLPSGREMAEMVLNFYNGLLS